MAENGNNLKPFKCRVCGAIICHTNGNFIRLLVEVRGRVLIGDLHIPRFELECPECPAKRLWVAREKSEVKL